MWKLLGCLIGFTLVSGVLTDVGDVVLSGTIMLMGGTMCVQADGNLVTADNCVKVVVVETDAEGEYLIQTLDGTRAEKGWTIALDGANSFTTGGGSTVVFFDGTNNLLTVDDITDDDAPFIIRLSTEAGTDCLKADGTYITNGVACAAADRFYFVVEGCSVNYCATCAADILVCVTCTTGASASGSDTCTCGDNTIANSGADTCDVCGQDETLKSDRTECLAHTCTATNCLYCDVAATCTQCLARYALADNTCTACGDTEIVVDNTCAVCGNDETLKSDGTECLAHTCTVGNCQQCDDAATCTRCVAGYELGENACTACVDNQILTNNVCTDCGGGERSNTDRNACVASCDVYCKFCDDENTCGECTDGYSVNEGACKEQNSSTQTVMSVSLLSTAVLLGVMIAK